MSVWISGAKIQKLLSIFFKKNITLYKNKYYFCALRLYIVKQEDDEKIIDLNY